MGARGTRESAGCRLAPTDLGPGAITTTGGSPIVLPRDGLHRPPLNERVTRAGPESARSRSGSKDPPDGSAGAGPSPFDAPARARDAGTMGGCVGSPRVRQRSRVVRGVGRWQPPTT